MFFYNANVRVYNVEIIGLCRRLETALSSFIARLVSNIYICINNLNIINEISFVTNGFSQTAFIRFREEIKAGSRKGKKY